MDGTSAQNLFGGTGFDEKYMLEKAARELVLIKKSTDPIVINDHIINFSITIASIASWMFHLKLVEHPEWESRRETDFVNWVRFTNPVVAAFIDVANESKHANRHSKSNYAEKIEMRYFSDLSKLTPEVRALLIKKGFTKEVNRKDLWLIVPMIKLSSESKFLYDAADLALGWWNSFEPDHALPLDI
ncbi:hypothetical protein [Rheinheimera faecalis]|uniref:hypothetical protein n=1 Tax=Rheinheimera faecalis TaxID=2901141 RepID=UPI001E54E36E|nr:hypothetical protein [Rheinheimera faecalis]